MIITKFGFMLIVIDGIDGSGKGTQVKLIEEKLKHLGYSVKVYDYPRYEEESSALVKKYLNGEYGRNISAKKASIFYAIDRFDSSFKLKEDLSKYDFIICNRYTTSNMIHQAGKIKDKGEREEFITWLQNLEYDILEIPKPDKVIFLNVTPKMSQELILKKEKREYISSGKNMDIHEEDINHLRNSWVSAMELVESYSWIKIDCEKDSCMRDIESINEEILANIV